MKDLPFKTVKGGIHSDDTPREQGASAWEDAVGGRLGWPQNTPNSVVCETLTEILWKKINIHQTGTWAATILPLSSRIRQQ